MIDPQCIEAARAEDERRTLDAALILCAQTGQAR
jgi:hypothetical protein